MSRSVVFYDAEKVIIDFLKEQLPLGINVGTRSHSASATFITVVRTGGSSLTRVSDAPIITIECYAPVDTEALALMNEVRELLSLIHIGASTGKYVYRAREASGLVNLPDPNHASTRYTMNFEVHIRGKKSTRILKGSS